MNLNLYPLFGSAKTEDKKTNSVIYYHSKAGIFKYKNVKVQLGI